MKITVGELKKLIRETFKNYDYGDLTPEEVESFQQKIDDAHRNGDRQTANLYLNALEGDEYALKRVRSMGVA